MSDIGVQLAFESLCRGECGQTGQSPGLEPVAGAFPDSLSRGETVGFLSMGNECPCLEEPGFQKLRRILELRG